MTATKRASTVQDVPFSINAQTQEDIQRSNAANAEELSRNIAGLTVQNLGPGQSQVSVRGVSAGQIVRDQPGVKEQVGVYLDESVISLSLFTPDVDLYDLNRIETLRGPQGTLFGSGSVGGTLRYITNQPEIGVNAASFEINANMAAEDDFGGSLKGMVNMDLGDHAAGRFVGYFTHFPGFIDDVGPAGRKSTNDGQRIGGRMSFLLEPTEGLNLTPRIVYQDISTNGFNRQDDFIIFDNQFTGGGLREREQYLLLQEGFDDETMIIDLTASYDLGGVELTSVSSYTERDIVVSRDASALTGSVSGAILGLDLDTVDIPSNLVDTTDLEQFTQEVRLGSTGFGPLQWVIGGFYSKVDRAYTQRLPTEGYDAIVDAALGAGASEGSFSGFPYIMDSPYAANLTYDFTQYALFGEASYAFGPVIVTAGGRYYDFEEERDFVSGGVFSGVDTFIGDSTSSDGFSPRLIVTYEATPDLNLNLQASKGFRLGGVNDPLNVPLCEDEDLAAFGGFQTYDDETLWNYEAGAKYSTRRITFNAAAFYSDISNLQTTVDAGTCSSRVVFNAEKAHTMGLEAEFAARITDNFDVSVSGSYVEAEFDTTLPGDLAARTGIRDGNRLPTVPKFQMAATAYYEGRLNRNTDWFVQASVQHVGSRLTQPTDQEDNPRTFPVFFDYRGATTADSETIDLTLPSYELVNLSFGLRLDRGYEVSLYANNIFDKTPLLSFDRELSGLARRAYNIGQPRVIGITLRRDFRND
ncbi:TonB-dependent receptor [Sphingomicrobium clamense]|uniref:TonB-dependent receptor n=1 Tax=Sphingomicrobium clamense TaxID=2851013 RepID=UPI0031F30DA0